MVPTRDRIRLTGIALDAIHGVHEFERQTPQRFVVDVTLQLQRSASDDDLTTTVDYSVLAGRIADDVRGEPVNLIETLAERIATTCLSSPLVSRVEVTVHKPDAPVGLALSDISVTITRRQG